MEEMMNRLKWTFLIVIIASLLLYALLLFSCFSDDDDDDGTSSDDDTTDDDTDDDTIDDDDNTDDDTIDDDDDTIDDDDCGDDDDSGGGVWVDESSGLMWQKTSKCCYPFPDANYYCHSLYLAGHNNWRSPTISELRSLIRGCPETETGGRCGVTDDCGYLYGDDDDDYGYGHESCYDIYCHGLDCPLDKGPADGCYWPSQLKGECDHYLSDTVVWDDYAGGMDWVVSFNYGSIGPGVNLETNIRCVRLTN